MAYRDPGLYIPTTSVWDVSEIYNTDVTKPEFKELLVRMYQNLNNMAMATNNKDSAMYDTEEFVNGQTFFSDPATTSGNQSSPARRNVFRKVIDFGALPKIATKSMPHYITITAGSGITFTRIYGCSTDPTNLEFIPIPYTSATGADTIELWIDDTNVNVTTISAMETYTTTYVVLEYLKQ